MTGGSKFFFVLPLWCRLLENHPEQNNEDDGREGVQQLGGGDPHRGGLCHQRGSSSCHSCSMACRQLRSSSMYMATTTTYTDRSTTTTALSTGKIVQQFLAHHRTRRHSRFHSLHRPTPAGTDTTGRLCRCTHRSVRSITQPPAAVY